MFRVDDLLVVFPIALAARVGWALVHPRARAPIGRLVLDAAFIGYLLALIQVVLGTRHLGGLGTDFVPLAHVNPVPFRTISEIGRPGLAAKALGQAVGNVVLFVPLGVLLPLTAARFRAFRPVLVAGALLSAGIEAIQLALLLGRLVNRSADIDDVMLNTLGTALGYGIWALLVRGQHSAEKARASMEGDG